MKTTIAFLGPQGTFCGEAAHTWSQGVREPCLVPLPTPEEVVAAVKQGRTEYGVLPLENSLEGSVGLTLDLLVEMKDVWVCGEVIIPVAHYLFAPPGVEASGLLEIHSHPQALAQSRPFILEKFPGIREVPRLSTAEAVAEVARLGGPRGALGARGSGALYGLDLLLPVQGGNGSNKTRFIVLGRRDAPPTGRDKTSLLFTVEAGPGRLYRILELFARVEIDLSKIESRPTKKELGEYIFFLDFVGHRLEEKASVVLQEIGRWAPYVKVLGSYPAHPHHP